MPQPTIGRQVHYVARGSLDGVFPPACRAATITEVGAWVSGDTTYLAESGVEVSGPNQARHRVVSQTWDPTAVGLEVHNPTGLFFHPSAAGGIAWGDETGKTNVNLCDGSDHAPGTWHWPARGTEAGNG